VGADAHEDRGVVLLQVLEGDVLSDRDAGLQLDAEVEDALDLGVDDVPGQAVLGDPVAQHAPGLLEGLEDRHLVAAPGQLVGARHPRRARPDHCDLLVVGTAVVAIEGLEGELALDSPVADEALHGVDVDRSVLLVSVAALLAGVGAHPAHDRREGVGLDLGVPGGVARLLEAHPQLLALGDHRKPPPDVVPARALGGAGGELLNGLGTKRGDLTAGAPAGADLEGLGVLLLLQ
jgi:hypothetical protein